MMDSNASFNRSGRSDRSRSSRDASSSPGDPPPMPEAYEPPRLTPLGTLPASTGMPVSAFELGDEPTR